MIACPSRPGSTARATTSWPAGCGGGACTSDAAWRHAPLTDDGNDEWSAWFEPTVVGMHEFAVEAWADHFATWAHDLRIRADAGDDLELELEEGARLIERLSARLPPEAAAPTAARRRRRAHPARAARRGRGHVAPHQLRRAGPRGRRARPRRGRHPARRPRPVRPRAHRAAAALGRPPAGAQQRLVRALPPLRGWAAGRRASACRRSPTWGSTWSTCRRSTRSARPHRKGRDNTLVAGPDDPGSPWAIGVGGRWPPGDRAPRSARSTTSTTSSPTPRPTASRSPSTTRCSARPTIPGCSEHPEWFHRRPDGSIRYAENPPKKYQDIYPINFWPRAATSRPRSALWEACQDILDHWIGHGVRIFRVDNPHTKPMAFWEWLLAGRAARPPRRGLPGRGVHRPEGDGEAGRGGLHPELHVLHVAPQQRGAHRLPRRAGPRAAPSTTSAPTSGPTPPTSSAGVLRHGSRPAFQLRLVLAALAGAELGHLLRLRAVRERAGVARRTRSTSTPRSTRSSTATGTTPDSLAPLITRVNGIRRAPPGVRRAALDPLPPRRQRGAARLLQDRRRRRRPGAGGGQPRPRRRPGGHAGARPRRARAALATPTSGSTTSSPATSSPGTAPTRTCASTPRCRSPTCSRSSPHDAHRPARSGTTAARRRPPLVPARGLLRGARPRVRRLQRRRHRRPAAGSSTEARLPRVARASTASGCCPSTSRRCATAATTSATSSRVLPEYGTVDDAARAASRRPTSAASASSPTW